MNLFTFIGRVGGDAVVRQTSNGKPVANWSVAVDSGYGDKKKTTWVRCTLWGDRGEKIAPHIYKGDKIGVSGELSTSEYEGKHSVDVNVREVELLGGKRQEARKPQEAPPDDDPNDSIPF